MSSGVRRAFFPLLIAAILGAQAARAAEPVNWPQVNEELMHHFEALVAIDTTDPPGNETKAVEYIKQVLDAENIPVIVSAKDPARANLIARVKGNGSKRPILLMGHTDTVQVDPDKWTFPAISATHKQGYIYGRGTLDNKWQTAAGMMTLILLKRQNVPLDRDVIFVAEAGEEASTEPGIEHIISENWADLDAEACFAEGGAVVRRGGRLRYALVQTAEKRPRGARLTATGPAGHGSRPIRSNALVHLAAAVEKIAAWEPPMRLNDTTRAYFEKMATLGSPQDRERYNGLLDPSRSPTIREYMAENEPGNYSMLHTSISPNVFTGGYQINVIPSEAEAVLDIRALPDEDMDAFYEKLGDLINDPAIRITPETKNQRPAAEPSRMDTEFYRALESAIRKTYAIDTVPVMSTGATDMAFLRAKGMQCYGVGPVMDDEDPGRGFGAHSDIERIREDALPRFMQFQWEFVTDVAMSKGQSQP